MKKHQALILLASLALPELAMAHTFIHGAGSFINGVVHPYVIAPHIIAIVIMGMFAGQHGLQGIRLALPVFAVAIASGLIVTTVWLWAPVQLLILVVCMLLGIAVAIARPIPLVWLGVIVAAVSFMVGLDSPQLELVGLERFKAFSGTLTGCLAGLIIMSTITSMLTRPWMKVGIRILGSWGAAAAVMVLALIAVNWR